MGKKAIVTLSFQVTLPQPEGMTIKETRGVIIGILKGASILKIPGDADLKIHLLNKETSYGKR